MGLLGLVGASSDSGTVFDQLVKDIVINSRLLLAHNGPTEILSILDQDGEQAHLTRPT